MSSRRGIRVVNGYPNRPGSGLKPRNFNSPVPNNTVHQRPAEMARKKGEKAIRNAHQTQRKIESYLGDDANFSFFANQLAKLGLELRDIPGDGNCLFRSLGDQLDGHGRDHFRHRMDVCNYMAEHKTDYEPFVDDSVSFDRYLQNLRKLGTYAGNDVIVAFSRLHKVDTNIHQLNDNVLVIRGSHYGPSSKHLHIAYHNGDHYSSVRKLHDNTESPANIKLQISANSHDSKRHKQYNGSTSATMNGYGSYDSGTSHSNEACMVRAVRNTRMIENEVKDATNCTDVDMVRQCLMDTDYDVDAAIAYLLQLLALGEDNTDDDLSLASLCTVADSGIWADTGTASRLFGPPDPSSSHSRGKGHHVHFREDSISSSSGYGSVSSQNGGAGAKPKNIDLTSRQKRDMKKYEKKKRAEERHKQKYLGINSSAINVPSDDDESVITVVSKDLAQTHI